MVTFLRINLLNIIFIVFCLEVEKQERSAAEHKALQVLQDVRKKWYRAEEERTEKIRYNSPLHSHIPNPLLSTCGDVRKKWYRAEKERTEKIRHSSSLHISDPLPVPIQQSTTPVHRKLVSVTLNKCPGTYQIKSIKSKTFYSSFFSTKLDLTITFITLHKLNQYSTAIHVYARFFKGYFLNIGMKKQNKFNTSRNCAV
jgi:hypothetical protein